MSDGGRGHGRVLRAVVVRPRLWVTAIRQGLRAVPRDWWRVPPRIPRPDPAYVRFRIETAYGADGTPQPQEVIRYLEWCRATERSRRRARRG